MLILKPVISLEEVEILRTVRNECRTFMTRHQEFITPEQQQEWFTTAPYKYKIFLVYRNYYGTIFDLAGFGLVLKNEQDNMVTGGLLSAYRDRGLGKELFKLLISHCDPEKPLKLELLKSNIRALKTYEQLGFVKTREDNNLIYMELNRDSFI